MDYESVEHLIKLVSATELTYFQIENDGIRIELKKEDGNFKIKRIADTKLHNSGEAANLDEADICEEESKVITSPLVGTFYSSSDPDSEPFVKVGDKVKKGDTLCIIEAMKLMNDVQSEFDGEVVEILVENGDTVEYGQKLFKIR